jgi:hypothetical protein
VTPITREIQAYLHAYKGYPGTKTPPSPDEVLGGVLGSSLAGCKKEAGENATDDMVRALIRKYDNEVYSQCSRYMGMPPDFNRPPQPTMDVR